MKKLMCKKIIILALSAMVHTATASENSINQIATQNSISRITNAWASLPKGTQQAIFGGAVLITAAYTIPKLYSYLTSSDVMDAILVLAQNTNLIDDTSPFPLRILKQKFNRPNVYEAVLTVFRFPKNSVLNFNKNRADLLFFKFLKAFIDNEIYGTKEVIKLTKPSNTFVERWITGPSEPIYNDLNQLILFNNELTNIIARLEKEVNAGLYLH